MKPSEVVLLQNPEAKTAGHQDCHPLIACFQDPNVIAAGSTELRRTVFLCNDSETTNTDEQTSGQCPLCQDMLNIAHLRTWHGYAILYCSECKFRFSDPMKDPDETFYRQHVLYDERVHDRGVRTPSIDWRYDTCLKLCGRERYKTLLDIGCGEGAFMVLAQRDGFDVCGIDLDDRAVTYAKSFHHLKRVVCARWETLQTMGDLRDFDVITLFDTLEHVASPLLLMDSIYGMLKSGGSVVITVPRLDRCPGIFDLDVDYPPHHLTLWTARSLTILLQTRGFVQIQVIQKPLVADDIILHLRWRASRFVRRHLQRTNGKRNETSSERRHSVSHRFPISVKFMKALAYGVITACVWLFRLTRLARRHTLFAMAKRPC